MSQVRSKRTVVRVNPTELMPIFQELLSRTVIQALLQERGVRLYWRALTPLVVLWGFIYQRLCADHSCDAVVAHLHSGAADALDPADPHSLPLSRRLRSENTSAYVQARQRVPEALLAGALHTTYQALLRPAHDDHTPAAVWKGHAVRILDGTTIRLRPHPDLLQSYTRARNQYGAGYWVVARVVAAFCLLSEAVVAVAEGDWSQSEPALARQVMERDPLPDSLYLGDQGFGVYRVAQTARALHQQVLLRVEVRTARRLWRSLHSQRSLHSGADEVVQWQPTGATVLDPTLCTSPLVGRLLYRRLEQRGFRPLELYLFTSLLDRATYPLDELVALYGQRQQVEVDLRHLKQTLEMEQLEVKTAALFRKELLAGMLTYNLIRLLMYQAAQHAALPVRRLSFARCWRRLREFVTQGVPTWVVEAGQLHRYVLERLAKCRLAHQPHKVKHEPRQVRYPPKVFPALVGSRTAAREALLLQMTS